MSENVIRVTVWNEYRHEKRNPAVTELHPKGIHGTIAGFLNNCDGIVARTATLDEPDHGLPDEVLEKTDVLIWWGHMAHGDVSDTLVEKIRQRVYAGKMGFLPLHSGHHSKPFKAILGTTGNLSWGDDQKEIIWNLCPTHPIAAGVPDHFVLDIEELYSEPFFIPTPDDLIFGGWFEHGNIFRAGCTFRRGAGKIFYFQPGHETCPSFHNPIVQRIIENGVRWVAPAEFGFEIPDGCPYIGKGAV